jgi:membrane protease YdiL (CAAX protease family)
MSTSGYRSLRGLFWNDDHRRLRAPWRLLAALVLFLLAATVLAGIGRIVAGLGGEGAGSAWASLVQTAVIAGLVGVVAGIGWLVDRRRVRDLGLSLGRAWYRDFGVGLCVGLLMATTVVLIGLVAGSASIGGTLQTRPDAPLALSGVGVLPATLLWLLFFLGVGTLEELIVRGYFLVNVAEGLDAFLTRRRAVVGGLLASSAVFGVLHAANPGGTLLGVLSISLAGLLLGGAYVTTDRLGVPVGIHVAWNFALGPVYGLPVSGLRTSSALVAVEQRGAVLLTGGDFGPEGGLVMLGALGVGVVLTAWWIGREEGGVNLRTAVAVPEVRGGESAGETARGE